MPNYIVKHIPLKQEGKIIPIGGTIELTEKETVGLEQFLDLAPDQGKPSGLNAAQTIELIKAAETPEALKQLLDEESTLAVPRKSVLDAISKREAELAPK